VASLSSGIAPFPTSIKSKLNLLPIEDRYFYAFGFRCWVCEWNLRRSDVPAIVQDGVGLHSMRRTGRAGSGEAPLAGGDPSAPLRHRHALSPPRQPLHHPPPLLVLRLHRRCTAAPQDPTRPLPHRCRVHLRPRVARLPRPPRHRRRHLLRLPPPLLPPRGTDSPPGNLIVAPPIPPSCLSCWLRILGRNYCAFLSPF